MSNPQQEKVLSNIFTELSSKLTKKYYKNVINSNTIDLVHEEVETKKDINVDTLGIINTLSDTRIINQVTDYVSNSLQFNEKNKELMKKLIQKQFVNTNVRNCISKLNENIITDELETDNDVSNIITEYIKNCIVQNNLEEEIYKLSKDFTVKSWLATHWKIILLVFIILLIVLFTLFTYNKKNPDNKFKNFLV